jgi:hypothetical protein
MTTAKPLPPAEHLRAVFRYDHRSGRLIWRARDDVRGGALSGKPVGGVANGVWHVKLKGYGSLLAHRVIWKMVHGTDPNQIDHINGDSLDNRLENLREATPAQNSRNRGRARKTDYRGVHRSGNCWRALIRVDGRLIPLGTFRDPEAAYAAYVAAARKHFGEFARLD